MPVIATLGTKMVVWYFMKVLNVAQEKEKSFFKKNGPIPASFSVYFRLFNTLQFKLKKA